MMSEQPNDISAIHIEQAHAFLAEYYADPTVMVELVGAGAWSRCYGYRQSGQDLAIRFGQYVDDFQKDQIAARYASAALPIPQVLDVGSAFGGYYAISTRVYGEALEQLPRAVWNNSIPSLVDAFEALRLADISATTGYGGWDASGNAVCAGWADHLLLVTHDGPDRRTYGWRAKLAASPVGEEAFRWGLDLLTQVAHVAAPRCLVHADLSNRNVLVDQERISGVFDWGCSIYGDHLYDLAWFEFWAPWHTNLDVPMFRKALEARWHQVGYMLINRQARLIACYLHIGLDHLAYNAHVGDWDTLVATAERMQLLCAEAAF